MTDIKQYEPLWGSWHVDGLLGEGSFGKVYRVHKEEFGKTYEAAVKMISIPQSEADLRQAQSEGLDAASARSYFHAFVTDIVQEIDLMSAFRGNSNIVSLEDHRVIEREGEIGWDILIRMELLTTLSEHVTKKPLTEEDVLRLGVHICRALELCAARHTIHRDIKPDNIFVSQYGDYKLGDFGIARQIERTMSGLSKKGTYTYMAPEVFKGKDYGPSVDLYSLGIVMYRFLNGNRTPFLPPFPEPITPRDRDEALRRRMSGEPMPSIPGIAPELDAIVRKACAYDRADRFADAAAMRTALEPLLGEEHAPVLQETAPREAPSVRPPMPAPAAPVTRPNDDDEPAGGTAGGYRDADEREGTVFVFAPQAGPSDPAGEPELSPIERLASSFRGWGIVSGVCFGLLALLSLVSGDSRDAFIFLPLYLFCAGQCALKFRSGPANGLFQLALVSYLIFSAARDFSLFDYSFLGLTLGLLSLWVGGRGRKSQIALCAALGACAVLSGALLLQTRQETHYAYVAGAAAIPLLTLLAAPAGLLLGHEDGGRAPMGFGVLAALPLFPLIAFAAYIMGASGGGASVSFYIADANFIGFSPDRFVWWRYARFVGLFLQLLAFGPLLALAAARTVPARLIHALDNRGRILHALSLSILIIVVGLVGVARLPLFVR